MTPEGLVLWYEEIKTTRGNPPSFDPMGVHDERCKACRNGYCISVVWERAADKKRRQKNPEYRGGIQRKEVCALCWSRNVDEYGMDEAGQLTSEWQPIQRADACNAVQPPMRRGAAEEKLANETDLWLRVSRMVEQPAPGVSERTWWAGHRSMLFAQIDRTGRELFEIGSDFTWGQGQTRESLESAMACVRWWLKRRLERPRWATEEAAMGGEFLSPAEFASAVGGISEQTVRRRIKAGEIKAVRLESESAERPRFGIPKTEVERLQAARKNRGSDQQRQERQHRQDEG